MPPNEQMGRDRDLVLPPNTFAFVLDSTKGKVGVYVGPYKSSLSNTDQLVVWEADRKRFVPVSEIEKAIQVFPMAAEGHYIVLSNPASTDRNQRPSKGNTSEAVDLEVGRKVNVPGPAAFPLWPGQTAITIGGHHLRHNQYLLVRVYDEAEARQNWKSAVVKPQITSTTPEGGQPTVDPVPTVTEAMPGLTMGQLMVVKGTEVSFYIPPTGIEVVPEGDRFVREAVTLERLEYCILLDENGEKRYTQGPAVVFPKPTEKFVEGEDGNRKFLAIELTELSGIYVKVIADHEEGGQTFRAGQELFITGKEQAIYFPRPEHSIIDYGGKKVHYAIAVPEGEGRYVLDRIQGTVDLIRGPKMFLPDPRTQVVVLRALDQQTVNLLYPGNEEARGVNLNRYREIGTRPADEHLASQETARAELLTTRRMASSRGASEEFAGDTMRRGTGYTPPRSIVLDTKYDGAVAVNIWPGYAVLVTDKTGQRRVEIGPKMVLLEYDETLMPLELSTGRPKTDARLLRTAYLRVANNQVGDIVAVETRDLVTVDVEISYRVNFEGETSEEQQRWFSVENYVKVLADHARSRIRNAAKRYGIQEFYTDTINIVRNAVLGETPEAGKRPGLPFAENGMRVYDVEVLNVSIKNEGVAKLLITAQSRALTGAIELSEAEETAERTKRLELLKRQQMDEREQTTTKEAELAQAAIKRNLEKLVAEAESNLQVTQERQRTADFVLEAERRSEEQQIELARKTAAQEMERLAAETAEFVRRVEAVDDNLITALQMFGDKTFVEKLVTAVGPAAVAAGITTSDLFAQIFKGTPFEKVMDALATRPFAVVGSRER